MTEVPGYTIVGDSDNAPLEVTLNVTLNRTTGLTKWRYEELRGRAVATAPVSGWETAHHSCVVGQCVPTQAL